MTAPLSGVVTLDLRATADAQFTSAAATVRRNVRQALDGLGDGDFVKVRVNRWSLPSDVAGLIPSGVRVQIEADDAATLRLWRVAFGVPS